MAKRSPIIIELAGKDDFAGQLRGLIEESGKTRYEVSKLSGVGESRLSEIYSGRRTATLDVLRAVAAALGRRVTVRID